MFGPGHSKEISDRFYIPFLGSVPSRPVFGETAATRARLKTIIITLFINFIPTRLAGSENKQERRVIMKN